VDDVIVKVPALSDQVVAAVVDESHRHDLRVVAHVSVAADVPTTKRLIDLGVDEFVHPPAESLEGAEAKETINLLARLERPVTTTLSSWDAYKDANGVERTLLGGRPFTSGMRAQFDHLLDVIRSYAAAGVKLVVGTDWFNRPIKLDDPRLRPGAYTLHEMDLLHRAGLSTPAILAAATRHAAEALRINNRLGTISEGKLADLVILDGDLLQDFSVLHRTVAVFKSGRLAHGSLP
jgi:imidazolonepropionase-like amidohydrolase